LVEKRLERLEVLAWRPGGDLFRRLDFDARPDVFQDRQAVRRCDVDAQLRQQFVVTLRFMRLVIILVAQQAERVVWREEGVKFRLLAQAVQAEGIKPLENVALFAVLRRSAVLFHEIDDVLKARENTFLARRMGAGLLGFDDDAKGLQQLVIAQFIHGRPRLSCERGRRRPPPCAFPKHPERSETAGDRAHS
jgi:hypothetical protein